MKQRIVISLIVFVLFYTMTMAQKEEKIYYNIYLKACSPSEADYYRVVNYDENGSPIGPVRDYYISGNILTFYEGAMYIDKYNMLKSVFIGKSISYYESGKIWAITFYDENGERVLKKTKAWHENGNVAEEYNLSEDGKNGAYSMYGDDGSLWITDEYRNGEFISKWLVVTGEDHFNKEFIEDFEDDKNLNGWPLDEKGKAQSKIILGTGLKMENYKKTGFNQLIELPFNLNVDFEIHCSVQFIDGTKERNAGLVWGYIDQNNYNFFYISADGHFVIGNVKSGKNENLKKGPTNFLLPDNTANVLSVARKGNEMSYYINGNPVGFEPFNAVIGSKIGFHIDKKLVVVFQELSVKQSLGK